MGQIRLAAQGQMSQGGCGNLTCQSPVPESLMVWGLPPPLSAIWRAATRVPVFFGENVRVNAQVAWAARVDEQSVVSEKSPGSFPASWILVMLRVVPPTFVIWTLWGALLLPTFSEPKLRLAGDSFTTVPVPTSSMTWGLLEALSEIEIVPELVPAALGENVALMLQLAPAASDAPQVEAMPNGPLGAMDEMVIVLFPLLVRVTA